MTLHRQPDDPGIDRCFPGIMPDHYGTDDWEDADRPEEPLPDPVPAWRVAGVTLVAGLAGALLLYAAWPAGAHQAPSGWSYPLECCSNRDCAEIPASAVREGPDGYEIELRPGQHPMVKDATFAAVVPYASARSAPDGAFHACISPSLTLLCFFAGARGY